MARMTDKASKCIAEGCGVKLRRGKTATQYCEQHFKIARALRNLRLPCAMVACRSPAKEDGYCEACRPFPKDMVPIIDDWSEGNLRLKTNTPPCPYTGEKNDGETYRSAKATKKIRAIRDALNG